MRGLATVVLRDHNAAAIRDEQDLRVIEPQSARRSRGPADPVGVDLPRVQQALASPQFEAEVNKWREKFCGKTVVAGETVFELCPELYVHVHIIDDF